MKRSLLVAWALLTLAFCWRLDVVNRPLLADNQLYFYMAERAASGVPPHVSHVDSKNELGVLITAAAIRAGRAVGVDDVLASRLISLVFAAAAVVFLAELATLLTGSAAAGHLAALAFLATRGIAEHSAAGNNVKIFLATFLVLSHLIMARGARTGQGSRFRSDILAGLAGGAAFICWQPALLAVVAIVVEALVARGGSIKRATTVLLASAIPVLLYESYFVVHGALAEQIRQAYVMTLLGSVHQPRRLWSSLVFLLTEAGGPTGLPRVLPTAFAIFLAGGVLRLLWAPLRTVAALRDVGGRISCLLAGLGAAAFTIYDHQGVPDLFFPDPYFALAAGALAAAVASAARRVAGPPGAALALAGALSVVVWQLSADNWRRWATEYNLKDQRRAADVLSVYKQQFDDVWVYGAVHFLGLAHLDNHVPYGLFYDDVKSMLSIDSYQPLRDGRMPEIIVYNRGLLPGASRYLLTDYVEITPPVFAAQSVAVWRRMAPQPGGTSAGDWRDLGPDSVTAAPTPLPLKGPRWERPGLPKRGMGVAVKTTQKGKRP